MQRLRPRCYDRIQDMDMLLMLQWHTWALKDRPVWALKDRPP